MSMNDYAVNVKNISKYFGHQHVVKDVTLQIKRGEIFGFLGPNGSGKTTTMRLLCGLLRADGGEGHCLGYDVIKESSAIKKLSGYLPQFFGLYKNLTVYQNLKLMSELHGLVNRETIIRNIIDDFNLEPYQDHLAGTLSGGWKQKLSLGAVLIHNPLLLLLDEPTASIDVQSRRSFWELMHDLSEKGVTIMFTSHNIEEIEHSHRISYMYQGQVIITGEIKDILKTVDVTAWKVTGGNLILLAKQLRMLSSIEQVITFPRALRILGKQDAGLAKDIEPYLKNPNYDWTPVTPNIEDVFVFLSKKYEKK